MELKKVTIDDVTYHVEPVNTHQMVTGEHHIFYGIQWYKVIGFNLHNHIKNCGTKNNCKV